MGLKNKLIKKTCFKHKTRGEQCSLIILIVLTPQIAGHNLKNKLGLIKFGNYDNNKKKIYT